MRNPQRRGDNNMFEMAMVVAVIIALGQFGKNYIPAKFLPILSLVLGIVAGLFFMPHETVTDAIMQGVIAGLTACGLFDQTKIATK